DPYPPAELRVGQNVGAERAQEITLQCEGGGRHSILKDGVSKTMTEHRVQAVPEQKCRDLATGGAVAYSGYRDILQDDCREARSCEVMSRQFAHALPLNACRHCADQDLGDESGIVRQRLRIVAEEPAQRRLLRQKILTCLAKGSNLHCHSRLI